MGLEIAAALLQITLGVSTVLTLSTTALVLIKMVPFLLAHFDVTTKDI